MVMLKKAEIKFKRDEIETYLEKIKKEKPAE